MSVGVVVNPAAGGGRLSAAWPQLAAMLEQRLGPLTVLTTKASGEGRDLAAQHVRNGARLVIVNREATPLDDIADLVIHDEIGATLTAAMRDLN